MKNQFTDEQDFNIRNFKKKERLFVIIFLTCFSIFIITFCILYLFSENLINEYIINEILIVICILSFLLGFVSAVYNGFRKRLCPVCGSVMQRTEADYRIVFVCNECDFYYKTNISTMPGS